MSEPEVRDAFTPPSTEVGDHPVRTAATVGIYWGVVFASPSALLAILVAGMNVHQVIQGRWSLSALVAVLGLSILSVQVVAGGWYWACRAQYQRWFGYPLLSLGMGTIWLGCLFSITQLGFRLTDGEWPVFDRRTAFVTTIIWLGVSLYALVPGMIIRWRIRRLTKAGLVQVES